MFLPTSRGWDVRERLGSMEPVDIHFRRERAGWRCSWNSVGSLAAKAYSAWRSTAPQRGDLLTTGVTPWGSVAGLKSPGVDSLQGLAEIQKEQVQTFPAMPYNN